MVYVPFRHSHSLKKKVEETAGMISENAGRRCARNLKSARREDRTGAKNSATARMIDEIPGRTGWKDEANVARTEWKAGVKAARTEWEVIEAARRDVAVTCARVVRKGAAIKVAKEAVVAAVVNAEGEKVEDNEINATFCTPVC